MTNDAPAKCERCEALEREIEGLKLVPESNKEFEKLDTLRRVYEERDRLKREFRDAADECARRARECNVPGINGEYCAGAHDMAREIEALLRDKLEGGGK